MPDSPPPPQASSSEVPSGGLSAGEPLVVLRGVEKRYGELEILRGIDLEVRAGEKIVIVGPSGSGKSTILRLLMTLEEASGGTMRVGGEALYPAEPAQVRRVRSQVGMVFQHFNLFPHLSALENVTLAPIQARAEDPAAARARGAELLAQVGLGDKLEAYPAQLSGGQKQRVAIARALALGPRVLLLDEVTSALDPELVSEVLEVLRTIARETEITMLLVTHEMGFAQEIADRVLFFDQGRILASAPPQEFFQNPSEPRVKQFLEAVLSH